MNIIHEYFKWRLNLLGYPSEDVQYRLSWCQGDGMAFYGRIEEEYLIDFAWRFLRGRERQMAISAIEEKGWSISIDCCDHHYSHFNTMVVEADCGDALSETEETAFNALFDCIRDDVVYVSKTLEKEGYAIVEAYVNEEGKVLRKWCTPALTVRCKLVRDPFEEEADFYIGEKNVYAMKFMRDVIAGQYKLGGLVVEIVDNGTDEVIGEHTCGGISITWPANKGTRALFREVAAQAFYEARPIWREIKSGREAQIQQAA